MGPFTVNQVPAVPQVIIISDDNGNPRSLISYTAISAILTRADGTVITPVGTIDAIDILNPSQVVLHWGATSPFPVAGTYQLQIQFSGPGSILDYSKTTVFEVEPIAGTTSIPMWASTADVLRMTQASVSDDDLAMAQGVIDAVSNRTPAASAWIKRRDIMWLQRAVAYQAAWMASQPGLFGRSSVQGLNQDAAIFKFASQASIYLAPLAERNLKNVSWLRSKSLRMTSAFIDGGIITPAAISDDSILDWEAM